MRKLLLLCLFVVIFSIATITFGTPLSARGPASSASAITQYSLNAGYTVPRNIIPGPDGNVWFTELISGTTNYAIARITTSGVVTDLPVPGTPVRMATGPDGNFWYTRSDLGAVSRMTPEGVVTTFPISGTSPVGITAGPDNNLWITEQSGNQILRLAPSGNVTGQFTIPTSSSKPDAIALGKDGNLWFAETGAAKIGRITATGILTEFALPSNTFVCEGDLVSDSSGNLWFCFDSSQPDEIAYMTPDGTLNLIPIGGYSILDRFAVGSDNNLWTLGGYQKYVHCSSLHRITTPFHFFDWTVFASVYPVASIASGGDGKIWLTASTCQTPLDWSILTFDPRQVPLPTISLFPLVSR